MQLSKQAMMTVYLIEIMCHTSGSDANGFTWFDALEKCRSVGSTITNKPNTSEKYWTKYYHSWSQWIGEYGCYFKSNLVERKNKSSHLLSSAGLCQEFCLENHESSDILFFAVKDTSCICLNNCPVASSVSGCSFPCLENQNSSKLSSCGGGSVYSVFLSRKVDTTSENLHTHERNVYLHRNTVDNTCSLICKGRSEQCPVNLTRQLYLSYYRNQILTAKWKKGIINCQLCSGVNQGCSDVDCNKTVDTVYCSNGKTFTVPYTTQIQSRTNKSTSSVFTTTNINTTTLPNEGHFKSLTTKKASSQKYPVDSTSHYDKIFSTVAEKNGNKGKNTLSTRSGLTILSISTKKFSKGHSKTLTTKKEFIKASSQKYPVDSTSQYETISSTVAEENEMKENGNKDLPFQIGILISTIGILIICIGVFAFCVRKRYPFRNRSGLTLPKPASTSHDTDIEERSLETNCNTKQIRPSTENYSCNYSLAGNINIELGNFSEEEQYHHLWEHANECNADDNYYMKAEHHASKKDNISFDGGENHYNCLRETMPLRYEEEDTYSHAQNVDLSNSSNYGVMNVKRKSEKIIGDDLYDHFETNQ